MSDNLQQRGPTPGWRLAPVSVPNPEPLTIDSVLVHGLRRSRTEPWTNRHDEFWPSWIVDDVPGARVWVYGYNSSVWLTDSKDHLMVHSVKFLENLANAKVGLKESGDHQQPIPVAFVGHSLGGVLIKQVCNVPHVRIRLTLPGTHYCSC